MRKVVCGYCGIVSESGQKQLAKIACKHCVTVGALSELEGRSTVVLDDQFVYNFQTVFVPMAVAVAYIGIVTRSIHIGHLIDVLRTKEITHLHHKNGSEEISLKGLEILEARADNILEALNDGVADSPDLMAFSYAGLFRQELGHILHKKTKAA